MLGFELVEEDEPQEIMPAVTKEDKVVESKINMFSAKQQERKEERRPELSRVSTTTYSAKMVVVKPMSFDQVQKAANHLVNSHSVVVDLTEMSIDQAQRVLDYLSGVVFAINGKASRVGTGIFLFTPANVSIEGAANLMFSQSTKVESIEEEEEDITSLLKAVNS
jgi:cell division inhibitor SepF